MENTLKTRKDDGKGHSATGSPPAFHYLFREQAEESPDSVALVDEHSSLTYRELDEKTDALAMHLVETGVEAGSTVGVYMERSAEYVVAMLAAMKAGAAFLPMELAYPKSMTDEVVADSRPEIVLTKARYEGNLPADVETISMDGDDIYGSVFGTGVRLPEVSADDLIFIAYSSGTTGKPKGIANPHRATVGSYLWRFGISSPDSGDRVGCNVFFIWEVLRPLLVGATSVVVPDEVIYDPVRLVAFLREYDISETLMTPSLLETVLNHTEDDLSKLMSDLRTLWLNGEVVTRALVGRASEALPDTRLLNVYSISEAHEVAAGDLDELSRNPHSTYCPVGRPMDSSLVRILDEGMRPVPDGEAGELYVGGEWLAREYINLPEKTAERFTQEVSGERIYRTGDRARLLPGGELEILGRCDFMVKVRGYSIELGAVENAIESSLPVKSCCVAADGDEGGDKRLVAYVVPLDESDEQLPDISPENGRSPGIRDILKDSLPHYAIPAVYVPLAALPLQETTGKVDRTLLPEPPGRVSGDSPSPEDIHLPETATDEDSANAICRIFEVVLRLDEGDVEQRDDFFEIGGHSLAAAEATAMIEKVFQTSLPVGDFLESSTPESLAARLGAVEGSSVHDTKDETLRTMLQDAVLDDDIRPTSGVRTTSLGDAKNIFLTGATGFLGAFLTREILASTSAGVTCLVRDRGDGSSPMGKVRDNLESHGLWEAWMEERLRGVFGNLGGENLGMSERAFGDLARSVDFVVHAGASVNLIYPYNSLRKPNVEGTRDILRLCITGRTKPLVHISTNGIFPPDYGLCTEDSDPDTLPYKLTDGYGQSKWVAEKLVREAQGRGLPTAIFRPGNISGHSRTGASNPKDFLTALFHACLETRSAPDLQDWTVEMSPVDFVCEAIAEIASEPGSFNGTYHLANPSPTPASTVFDLLEDPDEPLERIALDRWLEDLSNLEGSDLARTALAAGPDHLFAPDSNRHDDINSRIALEDTDVRRPPTDSELLGTYRNALQRNRDFARQRP